MERSPEFYRRRQKAGVFVAFLLVGLILFLIQLWLFVTVLDHLLAGQSDVAVPAAVLSVILLGLNVWMLIGVNRLLRMR